MNTDNQIVVRLGELLQQMFRTADGKAPASAERLASLQADVELLKLRADSPGRALRDILQLFNERASALERLLKKYEEEVRSLQEVENGLRQDLHRKQTCKDRDV